MESRIFITGDKHGQFRDVKLFCKRIEATIDDTLIVLGDAGINLYGDERDTGLKKFLSKLPISFFCIHGNHEARPHRFSSYQKIWVDKYSCYCYWDSKYPNIYFPEVATTCYLNGHRCLVCGGAYSVDKYYRLKNGWFWDEEEQLTGKEKSDILLQVIQNPKFEYVFTHTAPKRFIPTDLFLPIIDQSTVDESMEVFLDSIYELVNNAGALDTWYCGHYHADKRLSQNVNLFYKTYTMLD